MKNIKKLLIIIFLGINSYSALQAFCCDPDCQGGPAGKPCPYLLVSCNNSGDSMLFTADATGSVKRPTCTLACPNCGHAAFYHTCKQNNRTLENIGSYNPPANCTSCVPSAPTAATSTTTKK